ncbi:pre-mRNA splicing factor [Aspergillus violaceofuscus CBS 115571]|uniref:U4/U6 snRNA-associated-splicing factor PRP24 n=1 Tax=Aspergillus violaceofuscus (strain CBS 115571) TaxID=1450538 RepID=A0A2V5IIA7_ASPV1|nr:pre-mRNA splicing factor [Aspergillus violaceofuscus CBS 115571]
MDINSLLSPQDSNSQSGRTTPSAGSTPANNASVPVSGPPQPKPLRKSRPGATKQGMTSSPLAQHVYAPNQLPDPSPPTNSPKVGPSMGSGSGSGSGSGTPPATDLPPARQPSTPGMDTLADLASMQHHQPQRPGAPLLRSTESYESQLSPSTMFPHVNPISHNTPTPRSSFDIAMSDGPRETAQRSYLDSSLVPNAQRQATDLFAQIQENPQSYEAHVRFIRLLHAGFVNHVYPPNNPEIHGDPRKYDLLKDMRTAREEMDKLFAMGEDLWAEWIQDESMLAQSVEERIAVMELCQRSVEEEYGSTKLWGIYGEWVLYLYKSAHGDASQSSWTEEDRIVGREVFTWPSVLEVWHRGAESTQWRIHDSHMVWDRFLDLLVQDLARNATQEKVNHVRNFFEVRLATPHATWDQTFQLFSGFVSNYYNANYESIMADIVGRHATAAKEQYSAREEFEIKLRNATESGELGQEYALFTEYLDWELKQSRRKRQLGNFEFVKSIYQRAVLRFPTDCHMWEDLIMYLVNESMHGNTKTATMATLDRATRHCPGSGTLWSQYLLSSEREGQSFAKIADIKHKATSTGLLDVGGMEEVLKVHTAWCSYLRRQAFLSDSTDEDIDVAEVGIRSAIESVQELGEKKYGRNYQGDPLFRLERIYIRYLSESGSWDSARETFKGLVGRRGNSYEFWLTYYEWELISWSKFVQGEATIDAARRTPNPSYATAVLKQAIKRTDLDWPEKIMQVYIAHCEDYEDSDELQLAILETRKAMRAITARRERDAREAAARQAEQQAAAIEQATQVEKRKREDEVNVNGAVPAKRARAEESTPSILVTPEPVALQRDRENATVVVKHLPRGITEHKVRQFFRHCGAINSLKMFSAPNGNSETAIIEFNNRDEAVVAQTRDQKMIDGQAIEVQFGSGSTLFVTNFPPTADDQYIRDLFREHGEIIDIRFPSLKYNTHRRFCYVQFKTSGEAYSATQLDGSTVGNGLHLVAKISDPTRKQDRHGPMYEGREIHVSNLDWKASEQDVEELFLRFGAVEQVRIPRKVDGGSKGFCYIVFASKEEAEAALVMHEQEYRSRPLQVKLSTPQGAKRSATTILSRVSASRSPSVEANGIGEEVSSSDRAARTLGLMNVPDTVNDARIRALVEPYGRLIKIILRPDHQGAIVEFADIHAAGRASLELEGQEIAPGRKLHVGSVPEMLKQSAEKRGHSGTTGSKATTEKSGARLQPTGPIKRPPQPGARGGKRGHLGVKRATGGLQGQSHAQNGAPTTNTTMTTTTMTNNTDSSAPDDGQKMKKSNDDFRAMIQQSRAG